MSAWDDVIDGAEVRRHHKEKITMKKIMSLMLGMSLVIGAASVAFAQGTGTDTKKTTKKSSTKKPSTKKTTEKKTS
jgi:hypothetical protein